MYILFIRHGESVDDLTDQYGGWADFPLTPEGHIQLSESASKIADLEIDFEAVYASPLTRAQESGRIIANQLSIPLHTSVLLKEKNGYGLLSGLNKDEARKDYPELVKNMEKGYVYGAEPHEKFIERVRVAVDHLTDQSVNLIAVTHGGFMNQLFDNILDLEYRKAHDGGFVLTELVGGKLKVIEIDGIDYEEK